MPSKLQNITELFNTTLKEISNNPENWTSFLITASNNYKYAFDEQVLIFAQKPEATACADIDTWNKKVKRWVNKGAKGIALLQDFNGLRHVFDVSDTHNYRGTKLKLWKIDSKYNEEIIETLEANFGELENKSDLAEAIISASYNSVEDNLQDYLSELIYSKDNSFLEELDEFNIEVKFRTILSNSVAYMTMQRCGINPFDYFSLEDFREIVNFNTIETLANLGAAASDIAENNLREIHKTIKNLEIKEKNQNRTFEENGNLEDTIINKDNERRVNYESRIQYDRRLSNTEFNGRGNEGKSESGQILSNEIKLFEGTQKRIIYGFKNEKRTFKSSFRYTNRGNKQNRKPYQGNDEKREYNGRNEEPRPDEMGSINEQFETFSRGDSNQRSDLQLNLLTEEEQKSRIADTENVPAIFEFTQEMIDRTIQDGSNFEEGKFRIYKQMTSSLSSKENIDFLKHEYGMGGSSAAYSGADFGQEHDSKGIRLYRGYKDNRPEKLLTWNVVEKRLKELIQIDRYLNPKEKEEYKKWLEEQEKVEKLINEEEESENTENKQEDELAKRVYLFIKPFDLYNYPDNSTLLNTDEDNIEIVKADINDTRNVIDYVNALKNVIEKLKDTDPQKHEAEVLLSILEKRVPNYKYHLGDTVYIGANEYEISSIDNNMVTLFDTKFPLFSKQMSFEEFESKVKENYSNNHLIVREQEEKTVKANVGKEQTLEQELYNFYNSYDIYDIDEVSIEQVRDDLKNSESIQQTIQYLIEILKQEDEVNDFSNDLKNIIEKLEIEYEKKNKTNQKETEKEDVKTLFESLFNKYEITDYKFDTNENDEIYGIEINGSYYFVIDALKYLIRYLDDYDSQFVNDDIMKLNNILYNARQLEKNKVLNKKFMLDNKLHTAIAIEENEDMEDFVAIQDYITETVTVEPIEYIKTLIDKEKPYKIGDIVYLEYDRKFKIDEIDLKNDKISLLDTQINYPIFREESITTFENLYYQNEKNALKDKNITQQNIDTHEIQKNKIQDFVLHPEILENEKNNFKIKNDNLVTGSPREKFANNIEAIKILKKCEEENRLATVDEQEIMSRYVGWGGLAKAFDDTDSSWSNEYNILKGLLSEEEYKDARASTLTAFYTPPIVIKSMYKALENLGVKNANILEPSCGIGNFLGSLPESMNESKLYGIEIDSISGRIARQLYQKANITVSGYEKVELPDSFFDVAIGNVPFGDFKVNDKKYEKNNFLIHDYFFRKNT